MAEDWDIERAIQNIKQRCHHKPGNSDVLVFDSDEIKTDLYDHYEETFNVSEFGETEIISRVELNLENDESQPQTVHIIEAITSDTQVVTTKHEQKQIIQLQSQQEPHKLKQETEIDIESQSSSTLGEESIFYFGQAFSSYEDICTAKEIYEQHKKIIISKRNSRTIKGDCEQARRKITENPANVNSKLVYTDILYNCLHSGLYKPANRKEEFSELDRASERKKRKTSTYKSQCPFEIKFTLSKDGQTLIVSRFQEEHNHICHSSIYNQLPQQRRLDAETLEETKMLLALKVKNKKIQQYLYSKGKKVTAKDILNLSRLVNVDKNEEYQHIYLKENMLANKDLQNLMMNEVRGSNSFEDVLALLMNHQDISFEIMLTNESVYRGIFFQTEDMKLSFDNSSEIVVFDSSYKLNELRMPLYVLLCLNDDGDTVIIALALAQYETKETLSWIAESFIKYNPNFTKVKYIMADKDMLERQELLNHFPNAQLLNCQLYPTLQNFKKEISASKMNISEEEREFSFEMFQNIVFAKDKDTRDSNITLLEDMAPEKVVDYFTENWEPIKDDWARGQNNRIEIFNGRLKSLIESYSSMTQFFTDLLIVIRYYEWKRNKQTINTLIKHPTN